MGRDYWTVMVDIREGRSYVFILIIFFRFDMTVREEYWKRN